MQRRGGSEQPVKGQSANRPGPHNAPTAQVSTADLQEQVAALTRELKEAREQQTATSDVLKVISRSTFDLQTVLNTLAESAAQLCDAELANIWRPNDGVYRLAASSRSKVYFENKKYLETVAIEPSRGTVVGRTLLDGKTVHVHDVQADPDHNVSVSIKLLGDFRTVLGVPLQREGVPIGVIALIRSTVRPFTEKQIELVETFADQAVIAIENARLFDEVQARTRDLSEALQQQTATADVLKVISRSTFDLSAVLNTLVELAVRLCDGYDSVILLREGEWLVFGAHHGPMPMDFVKWPLTRSWTAGRAVIDAKPVHVHDLTAAPDEFPDGQAMAIRLGHRTILSVPLLREGEAIGSLTVRRAEVRPFSDKQIELVETFADQAVIAIENVRLFDEVQTRTRELAELLKRQTATSEVLSIISSSAGELQPVFETMLAKATELCEASYGTMWLREGNAFRAGAIHGALPEAFLELHRTGNLGPGAPAYEAIINRQTCAVADLRETRAYREGSELPVAAADIGGVRTMVAVPMFKEDEPIGVISIYRREVRPFSDKQIELVSNFAKQAVIAIENARLLSELRESLQQQTATADVLKVISSSPGELEPVFDSMLANATRLCAAKFGTLFLCEGDDFRVVAQHNTPHALAELRRREPIVRAGPRTATRRSTKTKQAVQIADIATEQANLEPDPYQREALELGGYRAVLSVPMLKDDEVIGAINIYRQDAGAFFDKQIELVKNFAAQAVIAIENTRLLNELRQRTDDLTELLEQQTATSEVLKVISSTPGELEPVFQAILENATRICEAKFGTLYRSEGDAVRCVAMHGAPKPFAEERRRVPVIRPAPTTTFARALATKRPVQIADVRDELQYADTPSGYTGGNMAKLAGARTVLVVPMLKDAELVGAIIIYRQEVRPFTDKQIDLLSNFAAQAVIAIENTRLLNELRESLQQQTATADVLKVISRSTFDLQVVLDTLTELAARLCLADRGVIMQRDGDLYRLGANYGFSREAEQYAVEHPLRPGRGSVTGRAALEGRAIHVPDVLADSEYTLTDYQRTFGYRTTLGVPLLREGETIGVMSLTRDEVNPFTEKQIELATTFADQAVIAIENVRLFNDVQKRTQELSEALEQQTATSEVLRVISSSATDLQPVFETIVHNSVNLCGATYGGVFRFDGEMISFVAHHNLDQAALDALHQIWPMRPDPRSVVGQTILKRDVLHVTDVAAEPNYIFLAAHQKAFGVRTFLGVPMLREGQPIGSISLYRREVKPFSDRQIDLVKAFADQAVIAIENVRLFDEVQKRTEELTESLQNQTATADVLKVISRSTFDLRTVLQTLVESAARFCDADKATIIREKDGAFYSAEAYGFSREFMDYIKNIPIEAERGSASGRALLDGRVVHIPDVQADPEYTLADAQRLGDYRTTLSVPMLREGVPIGVLTLTRSEVRPFTDKQIELVTTFADQAAIAIENVRLFESVEARTRELAKSLEDLRSAQDRLVQTEKLASLGQLTAGIAHEIKNPLNFVNNFSGVSAELIDELQDALSGISIDHKARAEIKELTETLRGNLDKVVQHGKRADAIVKNMLLHSRAGSGEHRPVDINALVEESLSLAWHGARAEKQGFNITLEKSFDPTAGEADVFPQEITRALLNLISNGFYAATKRKADANGGDYEPTLAAATKNLGDRVEIRIRDNGTGIPPEVKDKLFSPFFTTKPAGEGTGLGLSISHDIIVKQHGGSIEVDTQPGEFTELRIILPRAILGQR